MSSGPKRRGCDVCRKRHVKCDRQNPSCSQCIKAGWTCPVYPSDFAFVNYSPAGSGSRRKSKDDEGGSSSRRGSPPEGSRRPTETLGSLPRIEPKPSNSPLPSPSLSEMLKQQFLGYLDNRRLAASFETLSIDAYIRPLAPLIGTSTMMDNAVRLLVIASALPAGNKDVGTSNDRALISAFGDATKSLRDALSRPDKIKTTGTLAAAFLLKLYEQYCDPESPARTFHARGLTNLVRFRGPESFQSEADFAILEAEAIHIAWNAMHDEQECFLSEPAWQRLLHGIAEGNGHRPGRMPAETLAMVASWCSIPGAQVAFREWIGARALSASEDDHGQGASSPILMDDSGYDVSLVDYLVAQRRRLRGWWAQNVGIVRGAEHQGPWNANFSVMRHVAVSMQLLCVAYMLASLAPVAALSESDIEVSRPQPGGDGAVDLGPRPYDLAGDLMGECKRTALIVRRFCEAHPSHPTFSDGSVRISMVNAWERTKDHQQGFVSGTSEEIRALVDWAVSPRAIS